MLAEMMAGFFKIDPTKSLPLTRLPFDMRMILESGRKNYQAGLSAQQNWIEGWQALMQAQVRQASTTLETSTALFREVLKEGTPEEKILRQAEAVKKLYGSYVENIREARDTLEDLNRESADMMHRRVYAALNEVRDSLEKPEPAKAAAPVARISRPSSSKKEAA